MTSNEKLKKIKRGWELVTGERILYEDVYDDIYDFCFPNRMGFRETTEGQRRDEHVFDDTAVNAVEEFSNRIQQGLTPQWVDWMQLEPGSDIPRNEMVAVSNLLQQLNDRLFRDLHQTNFSPEVSEGNKDLAVGWTMATAMDSPVDGIIWNTVPQENAYVQLGPFGTPDLVWRKNRVAADEIEILWPQAKIPDELAEIRRNQPSRKVTVVERQFRNRRRVEAETYEYLVMWYEAGPNTSRQHDGSGAQSPGSKASILWETEFTGQGSAPLIVSRYSKVAGEQYGRGPCFRALPSIRSINLTFQMLYDVLEMTLAPVYSAEDDGVMDPDQVSFDPGAINVYAQGSKGFDQMNGQVNLNPAQFMIEEQRDHIKKAFHNETLGPARGTPPTAFEISERMADLSRQLGPVLDRLIIEDNIPRYLRHVRLMKERGEIDLPRIDGRDVRLTAESPLAKAQKNENITRFGNFVQQVNASFGPIGVQTKVKQEDAIDWLAEQWQIPARLIRSNKEVQELAEETGQQAADLASLGEDPQRLLEAATRAGPTPVPINQTQTA